MPLDLTYLILIPAILFSLWAQARVKTTYARYSKAFAGLTGQEAARMVLEMNGVTGVTIEQVAGELTDRLLRQNVKALIAACGSISCNAGKTLSSLPVPCYDVVTAAAEAAARSSKTGSRQAPGRCPRGKGR